MTTGNKDIASFFENGTTEQFEFCYNIYPKVLEMRAEKRCKKPQELIRLDQWYQNELPKLIKARGKDAHMVYDELVQSMKWKQTRGKFYPQLSYLVKVNTPRAVMQETKKAFRKLPNLEQAITALSNLKGVGTTMASALLAAAAPDSAPFMADECLMAIPEIEGIDYTTKEYLNFVQHIQTTVQRLNLEAGGETPFWSPHRVELALWAHYVANDLSPEMLDEMPGPGAGGGANTNGKTKAANTLADGAVEDTYDGESLGAVGGQSDINHIATESETENDNTNPAGHLVAVSAERASALQDGDSNFVSNDSTSQEQPIIDENTTQTTTSTDDGDVATTTPLASDSESNIEAPPKAKNGNVTVAPVVGVNSVTVVGTADPEPIQIALANNNKSPIRNITATSTTTTNNNNNSSDAGKLHAIGSVNAAVAGAVVAPSAMTDEEKTAAPGTATPVALGNGNGSLPTATADSLDGENNSCQRSLPAEVASECDDDDDDDDDELDEDDTEERTVDESSNSNSRAGGAANKLVTPIINSIDGNTTATNATNDSNTLSSSVGGVGLVLGQKRAAALHCGDAGLDDANSQPDMKKLRSD